MLEKKTALFLTIPESLEAELAEEILDFYRIEADSQVPILQNIVGNLVYYMLRYAYFEVNGRDSKINDRQPLDMDSIRAALSNEVFEHYYSIFKQNIQYFLDQRQYVYQNLWIYDATATTYFEEVMNSPLQEVW